MGSAPSQGPWNYAAPGTTATPQPMAGASGWSPDFNFAAPGTTGGPQQTIGPGGQQAPIWDRLMKAIGTGTPLKMPGTTIGAPAGQTAPPGPPPMLPQTQMPRPPGLGPNFPLQQPGAAGGGNNSLMAQYMALQQLMRGA